MQAKRCGAEGLSAVFSVHVAEVLLKRHAWVQYQHELDHLTAYSDPGKLSLHLTYCCAVPASDLLLRCPCM